MQNDDRLIKCAEENFLNFVQIISMAEEDAWAKLSPDKMYTIIEMLGIDPEESWQDVFG